MIVLYALAAALGLGVLWLGTNLRVVKQFERGVVFRFGRVQTGVRAPGLTMLIPIADRLDKGQHADHHDARPRPRRHHPRQRDRPRGCRHLLQCRRSGARGRRRPGLHVRHRPSRTDIAAFDHRQKRPGRPAVQSRTPQPGPGIDDRQPRVGLGSSHRPRRNQGRHPARFDEAVDVTPSRSRA